MESRPAPHTATAAVARPGAALWSAPMEDGVGLVRAVRTGEQSLVLVGSNVGTTLPTTQAGPGAFVNAEQTIVCIRTWTEVHTLRALVTTPPFPGDPRDLPVLRWVGVAVSAPFAVR